MQRDAAETVHIGFIGSRAGMTEHQRSTFSYFFHRVKKKVIFHHGDRLGADYSAHGIVKKLVGCSIIVHPPLDTRERGFSSEAFSVLEPKPSDERYGDIIEASDFLFALPSGEEKEQPDSQTWNAVRFAQKVRVPVTIIYPNGSYEDRFPWEPV